MTSFRRAADFLLKTSENNAGTNIETRNVQSKRSVMNFISRNISCICSFKTKPREERKKKLETVHIRQQECKKHPSCRPHITEHESEKGLWDVFLKVGSSVALEEEFPSMVALAVMVNVMCGPQPCQCFVTSPPLCFRSLCPVLSIWLNTAKAC